MNISLSKVMKHIIYHSIMSHLNRNDVLYGSQHSFRAGYSCSTQLISLIEDLNFHVDHNVQVDMILLHFLKAFDTVPHCRLLKETEVLSYWESSYSMDWKWFTACKQHVLLDGESSDHCTVSSGVPQGTVLGLLMFLIYINDITEDISSQLRLFADDCLLYLPIKSEQDSILLQWDLGTLSQWAKVWQMRFNLSKCTVMRCTMSHNPIIVHYSLHGSTLSLMHKHMYLGVMLNDHFSWFIHVTNVANKATRMLDFLKHHLSKCSSNVKVFAYLTVICLNLWLGLINNCCLPFLQINN